MVITIAIGLAILLIGIVTIYKSVIIVNEGDSKLLFVLGEYKSELNTGLNIVPPFISSIKSINTKSREISVPRLTEISGDDKRVSLEVSVHASIDEPSTFVSSVDEYEESIWRIAKSELTNIITESDAEGFRRNQREVEKEVREHLENTAIDWGVNIERVDITSISVEDRDN